VNPIPVSQLTNTGVDLAVNALGGDSNKPHWEIASSVLGGIAGAYTADYDGVANEVSNIAGTVGKNYAEEGSDLQKAMNLTGSVADATSSGLSGDIGGALAGVGEIAGDVNDLTGKGESGSTQSAVGKTSNAITSSEPQYAGNGNGVNNSLNPAFGNPSIRQDTQNAINTQMSSDDQAKTMLNIA
jgi:hypothetical protein